ncbi:MAG: DUF2652 domain-containing protein [Bacteroidota bacterium]
METQALLFIPDMSGFTKFITETEIQHSNHIISELIEVILKSNELNLSISEIEGDAVLFYRVGEPPKTGEIIRQSKKMFIDFHVYLKVIERDNVCRCGACKTASSLTLKFITHYGEIREVAIQRFHKLIGRDVILAHSLLKSSIPTKEYLLLSEQYLETQHSVLSINESWITIEPNVDIVENFGEISTKYIPLTPLRKFVPAPPKLEEIKIEGKPIDLSIHIDAPILLVHEVLTDAKSKIHWVAGIREVRDTEAIPRINSSHTCIFEDLEIHVVTKKNSVSGDEIKYIERGETSMGLNMISDYKLKEVNSSTHLSLRIVPQLTENIPQDVVMHMVESVRKSLGLLKEYCEKLSVERDK